MSAPTSAPSPSPSASPDGDAPALEPQHRPLVSVVIPCYNAETRVAEAVESALEQTYANVGVVVVDDGSTDDSRAVLRSFDDHIRWERQSNQGAPAARNRGLEMAEGRYVKFLDADDVLVRDCIEQQVRHAESLDADRKQVVFGEAIWVDGEGRELETPGNLRQRKPGEDPVVHVLHSNPLTSCPLHRREYLLEVGGFDPTLPRSQEHDLHLRLALSGVEFVYVSDPAYYFRQFEGSGRISERSYAEQGLSMHYNLIQRHRQLIEESKGTPLPQEVRTALAKQFWQHGRAILREGYPDVGADYFDRARELAGTDGVVGSWPYRVLTSLAGPLVSEKIVTSAKRILGR